MDYEQLMRQPQETKRKYKIETKNPRKKNHKKKA